MSTESEKAREALIAALEKEPDILPREAERIVDRVLARLWIEGLVLTCHKGPSTNPKETRMTRVRITGGYLNIDQRGGQGGGRPIDPDYGVDEGDQGGNYPDQGLPGGWGGQRPIDPGFGRPGWGGGDHPSQGPVWGQGGRGDHPSQGLPAGPIRPIEPGAPDNSLPPGTIVPPLPPDLDIGFHGKAYLGISLIYQGQRHHHHIIVNIPEVPPERPARPEPKKA